MVKKLMCQLSVSSIRGARDVSAPPHVGVIQYRGELHDWKATTGRLTG